MRQSQPLERREEGNLFFARRKTGGVHGAGVCGITGYFGLPKHNRGMKKTFKLNIEGKNRDRVLDAVKHEIRKYVKRERRRELPEGVDFWDFDCRFGATEAQAVVVHFATLTGLIDGIASAGGEQFYVEILASHGRRQARPAGEQPV